MFQPDFGEDRQQRRHDVRAVEAAAHAGLQHGDLHVLLEEPFERHDGGQFEKRALPAAGFRGLGFVGALDFVQQAQQVGVGDRLA